MNKINTKKVAFISFFIVIFIMLFFFFFFKNKDEKNINNDVTISNLPQEDLELGTGYGLQLNKLNSNQNSQSQGQILLDTPQDKLEVQFNNRGNSGKYILKVFYDYEEVLFKVGEENIYDTSYMFELDSSKSAKILFELDKELNKDNKAHKITVGIYASPEKHAKTLQATTNTFGITLDYEIYFDKNNRSISLEEKTSKPLKNLDIQYEGIVIGNYFKDLENLDGVQLPPYSIKAKKGEEVQLSYFAGNAQHVKDYLIVSMLNWEQVQMNKKPYLLLKNNSLGLVGYGTFSITAPSENGLYEFTSFIIPDPSKNRSDDNFYLIESAYRFTLEVE